jgi:hypothetical protein
MAERNFVQKAVDAMFNRSVLKDQLPKETTRIGQEEIRMWQTFFGFDSSRRSHYAMVAELLRNHFVVRAGEIYADYLVAGEIGDKDSSGTWTVDLVKAPSNADEIIEEADSISGIKDLSWEMANEMILYGDSFWEPIVAQLPGGRKVVHALQRLPVSTINRIVPARGGEVNKDALYEQIDPMTGKRTAVFSVWQLLHFNAASRSANPYFPDSAYGYRKSLLDTAKEPFFMWRTSMMALWLARVRHGQIRYKHKIDTSGMSQLDGKAYVDRLKMEQEVQMHYNTADGKLDMQKYIEGMWFSDVWLPVSSDYPDNDVSLLLADFTPSIADIEEMRLNFISALKTPPYLLGFTEDLRMRATGQMLDAAFLRNVMRYSKCLGAALRQYYRLVFFLAGVDPSNVAIDISFPLKGTADELLALQIEQLRASIIKILGVDIGLDWTWVFKQIYNLADDEIAEILKKSSMSGDQAAVPAEIPAGIVKDKEAQAKEILWQAHLQQGPMAGALNSITDILKLRAKM